MQRHRVAFHQAHGALDVIGRSRMVKSLKHQVIVFIPLAGTDVVVGHVVALLQPLPQQFGKEMVIAVPTPLVVQGDDEEVGMFEIFQGFLPGSSGLE